MTAPQPLSPASEEVLRRLVLAELDPASDEAREALATDPDLAAQWAGLADRDALLDSAGQLQRDVLADTLGDASTGDVPIDWDARVHGVLQGGSAADDTATAPTRFSLLRRAQPVAALAALVLGLVVLLPRPERHDDGPAGSGGVEIPSLPLGGPTDPPQLLATTGLGSDAGPLTFHWQVTFEGPDGACVVELYDAEFEPLDPSPRLPAPGDATSWAWSPAPETRARLEASGTFYWQVRTVEDGAPSRLSALQDVSFP